MASVPQAGPALTLGEFLARPDIDQKPYQELIDGRVEVKMSPQVRHTKIQKMLVTRLDAHAAAHGDLGEAFAELRCTYADRSILPDVSFLRREQIPVGADGRLSDGLLLGVPDLHVEVVSPDQSLREQRERLLHSAAHGARLGWLIDPYRERVEVIRPGEAAEVLPSDGVLTGEPVLPGLALPVAEVWSWLRPAR